MMYKVALAAICMAAVIVTGEAVSCYSCAWIFVDQSGLGPINRAALAGVLADHNTDQRCEVDQGSPPAGYNAPTEPSCTDGCVELSLEASFQLIGQSVTATIVARGCQTDGFPASAHSQCSKDYSAFTNLPIFPSGASIKSGDICGCLTDNCNGSPYICTGPNCSGSSQVKASLAFAIVGLLIACLF